MVFIGNADMKRLKKLVRRDEILSRQLNLEKLTKNICVMAENGHVRLIHAIEASLNEPFKEYEDFLYLKEYIFSETGLQDSMFFERFMHYAKNHDSKLDESIISLLFVSAVKKTILIEELDMFLKYQDNQLVDILDDYMDIIASGYGYASDAMFLDIYRYVRSFDFDYYQINRALTKMDKSSVNNSLMKLLSTTHDIINKNRL